MLTKLIVRNFKRFAQVEIELADLVVFVGPNNSGKTSALQALALWEVGLRRWTERRKGRTTPEKRPGVTISRRDLIAAPVPDANLLWRNLQVRDVQNKSGRQVTQNIRVEVIVEGITEDKAWRCGLEFDYANEESFYCRLLRSSEERNPERMPIPPEATKVKIAFLPPMSGLAANEVRLDPGAINVRVGEGRTAEVLRNLCHSVYTNEPRRWDDICGHIEALFGSRLLPPRYIPERGEIVMTYREAEAELDLSSSGRGLQQTLLLLAYMHANPGAVLLLDEPDAHLEILRQRQTYQLLTDVARNNKNQIVAASHSEVLLNEAAERDVVVAFVGLPHRINDRGSQVLKSLREIGFEHYYQAKQTGWVLYLEGSTDLAILRSFAARLDHVPAQRALERPFVHYVGNSTTEVQRHFFGLREASPQLKGVALFDKLDGGLPTGSDSTGLVWQMWRRREIESYLCFPETLIAYAQHSAQDDALGPLFSLGEVGRRASAMNEAIREVEMALNTLGRGSPWDPNTKVSDDFLPPLFEAYFKSLDLPNIMAKSNYHQLALFVPTDKTDDEIRQKLDIIASVANEASPSTEE